MLQIVTKQVFEYFLETQCDGATFQVSKTSSAVFYFWKKHDEVLASQVIEYGHARRFYKVKV